MLTENRKTNYCITACSWQESTAESRKELMTLIKRSERDALHFCRLFFERFFLVHEFGHIIQEYYETENPDARSECEKEYLATLFSIKYFQYKNESTFLVDILKWIDYLFDLYNVKIVFHEESISELLERNRDDVKKHGLLQFVLIKEAVKNKKHLNYILKEMSSGQYGMVNPNVPMRKGLTGKELIDECSELVFSLHERKPNVRLEYCATLGFQEHSEIF